MDRMDFISRDPTSSFELEASSKSLADFLRNNERSLRTSGVDVHDLIVAVVGGNMAEKLQRITYMKPMDKQLKNMLTQYIDKMYSEYAADCEYWLDKYGVEEIHFGFDLLERKVVLSAD
jgi:hypothetical protein